VYQFNDTVDKAVFRPVTQAYTFFVPAMLRSCVHNIFTNLDDIWAGTNSFLQGRGHDFANTLGRFLFNTTMGLGGCFDVASANGARKIPNDFGVTLGVYGIGQGPYLVLPLWGASTVRDGVALVGDVYGNQIATVGRLKSVALRNSLWGLRAVDLRASLLDASITVDRVALDPYSFVRDAYLQRREAMVLRRRGTGARYLPNYDDEDGTTSLDPPPRSNSSLPEAR
jgi:phospholipid-binding lipoprotein MlaA